MTSPNGLLDVAQVGDLTGAPGADTCENGPANAATRQALGTYRVNDHNPLRTSDRMDILTPQPTSVYRYYDRAGLLLYVGITSRATSRQTEHNRDKEWWSFVATQTVEHFPTRGGALAREKSLIHTFRPPFNRQHNAFHAELRELYLAATQVGGALRTPADEAASQLGRLRHRLPLYVVSASGRKVILATEPGHGALVRSIERRGAVPLMAGKKVGSLVDYSYMGDRAVYAFDLRASARPFDRATAHVKASTEGAFAAWIHQVKVAQ